MEIRWLETFAVAARKGSQRAAADALGYARSTVTGHIQSLERSLGAELFDRRSPGHPLTISGVALIKHAEGILEGVGRARAAVIEAEEGKPTSLLLGTTSSVCSYRLPVFLRMLGRFLPELRVEVEAAPVAQLREYVATGRRAVVLVNEMRKPGEAIPPCIPGTDRRVLWEEEILLVGTPGAFARTPHRLLLTEPGCVYRDLTEEEFLNRMPDVELSQVGSLEGVKAAVLAGLGIGLLPLVAIEPWLSNGQLKGCPPHTDRKVITGVVWNLRSCAPAVAAHLERIRQMPVMAGDTSF
jgi:DNA-binding transcriptional LysR family regulator